MFNIKMAVNRCVPSFFSRAVRNQDFGSSQFRAWIQTGNRSFSVGKRNREDLQLNLIHSIRDLPWLSVEVKSFFHYSLGNVPLVDILLGNPGKAALINKASQICSENHAIKHVLRELDAIGELPGDPGIPYRLISVLLSSKLFGIPEDVSRNKDPLIDYPERTETQQYSLGLATELLYFSQLFHKTVQDTSSHVEFPSNEKHRIEQGNKFATLLGDMFIAEFYSKLALVGNKRIFLEMNDAFTQCTEEIFDSSVGDCLIAPVSETIKDSLGQALTAKENLIANALHLPTVVAGHNKEIQSISKEFGQRFGKVCGIRDKIDSNFAFTNEPFRTGMNDRSNENVRAKLIALIEFCG